MENKYSYLGKKQTRKIVKKIKVPSTKYRVTIKAWKNKKEVTTNSFMIYDFTGKTNIKSIKNKLMKAVKISRGK